MLTIMCGCMVILMQQIFQHVNRSIMLGAWLDQVPVTFSYRTTTCLTHFYLPFGFTAHSSCMGVNVKSGLRAIQVDRNLPAPPAGASIHHRTATRFASYRSAHRSVYWYLRRCPARTSDSAPV